MGTGYGVADNPGLDELTGYQEQLGGPLNGFPGVDPQPGGQCCRLLFPAQAYGICTYARIAHDI